MTDYYVDPDASGANDGSSWTDAWTTIQSAFDAASAGDTVYCAHGTGDDETPANTIDIDTNSGSIASGYIKFVGVNSSHTEDGTRYVIDGSSLASGNEILATTGEDYIWLENFELKGATGAGGHGLAFNTANAVGWMLLNTISHDNGGDGFRCTYTTASCLFFLCQAYDNTGDGWGGPYYDPMYALCRAHDNGGYGFEGGTYQAGRLMIGCIADSNDLDGFELDEGRLLWECVAAWNGTGDSNVKVTGAGPAHIFGLRSTHNSAGIGLEITASKLCTLSHAYFGGNNTDIGGSYDAIKVLGDARITTGGSDTNHGYTDATQSAPDFNLRSDATFRNQAIAMSPRP